MYNNIVVLHYGVYILISAALTLWVGKTLFKNGRIFLSDSFNHNDPMVNSVNHLVTVGFYLITFGIVALFLRSGATPQNMVDSIEMMSTKIGVVLLLLVIMHFLNILGIAKMRLKSLKKRGVEAGTVVSPDNNNNTKIFTKRDAEAKASGNSDPIKTFTEIEDLEIEDLEIEDLEPATFSAYSELEGQFNHDGQDSVAPTTNSSPR